MISSLIAGLVLVMGQDEPRDYKFPVMPMWQFGQWFGKETGREVIVLPQVQDRLVYINVKKRTLPELLGFVKQSVGVGVLDRNGVLTLTDEPYVGDAGRLTKEDLDRQMSKWKLDEVTSAQYEEGIKKVIDFQEKQQRPGYQFEMKDYEEASRYQGFEPTARALRRIVLKMGSDVFLRLPERQRVVFSTRPTNLQKAWVGDSAGEMKRITQGMQLRNEVLDRVKKPTEDEVMYYYDGSQLTSKKGGTEQPVVAMHLVVTREPYGVMVSLRTFDDKGRKIGDATDHLSGREQSEYVEITEKISKFFENDKEEYALNAADESELKRLELMGYYGNDRGPITPEDLDWLTRIDVNEPFAGLVSRVYDFGAEALNVEVVMEVTGGPNFYETPKSLNVQEATLSFMGNEYFSAGVDLKRDGLIVGKRVPAWYYEQLVPRRSVAQIARLVKEKGRYTFDDLAEAMASLPHRNQVQQFFSVAMSISSQASDYAYLEQLGWSEFMLLAYSTFTPAQRKQVFTEAGLKIGLNQLSKKAQDYFWETANHAEFGIGQNYGYMPEEHIPDFAEMGMIPKGYQGTDWALEQTFFMAQPAGMPIVLEFRSSSREGIYAQQIYRGNDGEEFKYGQFQDLEEYARNAVFAEMAAAQGAEHYSRSEGETMATEQRMTLQVNFGSFRPDEQQLAMFKEPRKEGGDATTLPDDVKKKLEELKAKFREEYKGITFGAPGRSGNVPPPTMR